MDIENKKEYHLEVDDSANGKRIDAAIAILSDDFNRSQAQKIWDKGSIKINGLPCNSKKEKVKIGDNIEITLIEKEVYIEAEHIDLDVVFENDQVAVINKPKGMLVHPTDEIVTGTVVNGLLDRYENLPMPEGRYRAGIVHRIDKDTSGLIVIAKTADAYDSLVEQFYVHSVTRTYTALVHGNLNETEATLDSPIGRCKTNRYKRAVSENGKRAITHYKVVTRFKGYDLIDASLETGRTHQIRVHLAKINHPLIGDWLYGNTSGGQNMSIILNGNRKIPVDTQMLHASVIGFVNPEDNQWIEFRSEPPKEFTDILEQMDLHLGYL